MTLLTREQIFEAKDIKSELVTVPEWGGDVYVTELSGSARDQFEGSLVGKNGGTNLTNVRAKLVAASVTDKDGNLLFTDKDVARLGKKSGKALDRIYEAAQRLSKITDDEVEELAKN